MYLCGSFRGGSRQLFVSVICESEMNGLSRGDIGAESGDGGIDPIGAV
jgi:hypothetical protein